jgi:predicted exporter
MAAVFKPEFAIQAAREFGLVDDAFEAFSTNVMGLQRRPLLVPESYAGTVFEQSIASGLYEREGVWSSVLIPGQIADVAVFSEQLADYAPEAVLIDLKQASVSLVQQYRSRILMMLAIAFVLICGVLLAALRPGRRLFWVTGGLLATVAGTLAVNLLLFDAISLFNLMAVVLVGGLGLDYLLFLSRVALPSDNSIADSRHAILASVLSTAAGFAVLASSAVPILSGLGFTVLTGVLIAFGVARLGSLN